MKIRSYVVRVLPVLFLAGLLLGPVLPASASQLAPGTGNQAIIEVAQAPAIITLAPIGDVKAGNKFTVSGSIRDSSGTPVPNKNILLTMSGSYLGQVSSNIFGAFKGQFNKSLSAGTYTIVASASATHTTAAATATVEIHFLPADVEVQTVPPIPGIPFTLNGQTFYSGEDGMAYVNINTPGQYRLSIVLDQYSNASLRVEFGRWLQQTNQTYQDIQVPDNQIIQVGLNVYQSVGQNFVDLDGYPVDPSRVSQLTIRSAQGDVFVFQSGEAHWIPASRVTRLYNGLEATPLLYSVMSVMVDGSNVVNQSQQRFYSHPDGSWPISLQLYSMHITSSDALFGFPVGKSVNVTYPDGSVTSYALDKTGSVEIHALARGNYSTALVGTKGINVRTPVALSRSQTLNTRVISYLDLSVVGGLGVCLAFGLLFFGRPHLLRMIFRKKSRPVMEKQFAFADQERNLEDGENRPKSDKSIIKWS